MFNTWFDWLIYTIVHKNKVLQIPSYFLSPPHDISLSYCHHNLPPTQQIYLVFFIPIKNTIRISSMFYILKCT